MAEIEQTKVCPLCAETIKAAAKTCPHCRHWQKKWSFQNPQTGTMLVVIMMIVAIIWLDSQFDNRDFAPYQNQITVVNSETSFRMVSSNLTVSVIGVITNQSDFGWKEIGMEAQFFDATSGMIDVIQAEGEYKDLRILPHSEASFKIEGRAIHKEQEYQSTKVFVRTGTDIHALFDD